MFLVGGFLTLTATVNRHCLQTQPSYSFHSVQRFICFAGNLRQPPVQPACLDCQPRTKFTMRKPRIIFNVENRVVLPGELLNGRVEIEGCDDRSIKTVRMQCVGSVYYKSRPKTELVEILTHINNAGRSVVLLHQDTCLLDVATETSSRQEKRSFPFSFAIETAKGGIELPSSFSNRHITVVYFLSVTIFRTWPRKDIIRCQPFIVACWNDTNEAIYRRPQLLSRGIDVGLLGMFMKGTIDARVSLARQSYCKGETIPIRMEINHLGNVKRITGVSISLIRQVKWRSPDRTLPNGQPTKGLQVTGKGLKVTPMGTTFKQLDIKPGEVNVDVTVDYFIDPQYTASGKKARTSVPPPRAGTSAALSHSDEFPWSSLPHANDLVQISYQLQVRLQIGFKEKRSSTNSSTTDLVRTPTVAPSQSERPGAEWLMDGMLSGGKKLLEFNFPIVIGTIPETGVERPTADAIAHIDGAPAPVSSGRSRRRRRNSHAHSSRPPRRSSASRSRDAQAFVPPRSAITFPSTSRPAAPSPSAPSTSALSPVMPETSAPEHRRADTCSPSAPPAARVQRTSSEPVPHVVPDVQPPQHSVSFPPPLPPRPRATRAPSAPGEELIAWSHELVSRPAAPPPPSAPPASAVIYTPEQEQYALAAEVSSIPPDIPPPPYSVL
ncbi:hypothetical protein DFJ77DRAFT_477303 [Powellomyces hirtus]|nr:hypothetical protein DFJ77DRAFT_477303 [Powellomyces hirtus]